jgi:predicted nucleic acid-binding protein
LIVVDSSVWIDFFRGSGTPQESELVDLARSDHELAVTGPILTEVLQGCGSDAEAEQIEKHLLDFTMLQPESELEYLRAALIFRKARSRGITVAGLGDLLVASACLVRDAWLLHNDRDFDNLATVSDLKIWKPAA